MSTAQLVPETWELDGDDAAETLRRARLLPLVKDAVERLRAADGMSHSRGLALALIMTVIPGIIAIVGLADWIGAGSVRDGVTSLLTDVSPGPTGDILTAAIDQGQDSDDRGSPWPLLFGVVAMLISGCTVFGQIERGANRIYGIEEDRPFRSKYGRAFVLVIAFVAVAALLFWLFEVRPSFLREIDFGGAAWLAPVVRVAIGLAIGVPAMALVFHVSPRRHQPAVAWLAVGSTIAAVLWLVFTTALKFFWSHGDTFGETYGPLAGVIGLTLWAYLISIGLFYGLAFAAQLEAVRAGCVEPKDDAKAEEPRRAA